MKGYTKDFIFLIIIAFLLFTQIRHCSKPIPTTPLKDLVKKQIQKKDSVQKIIIYRDSIRTKIIIKYRQIRHDSITPCEEKLVICDTVLVKDSALISEYKELKRVDSSIIHTQGLIIRRDSVVLNDTCKYYRKKIRRLKWEKRGILAMWIVREMAPRLAD